MAKDTKKRILEETLNAFSSLRFEDISLSEIANRVGISKAAIFRHFANKQELFDTLDDEVMSQINVLREQLLSIDRGSLDDIQWRSTLFEIIALFFSRKSELFPYILQKSVMQKTDFSARPLFDVFEQQYKRTLCGRFDMTTMCFFLLQMVNDYPGDKDVIHRYAAAVSHLIEYGFSGFDELSDARMAELDQLCCVDAKDITHDRFFIALEHVLSEYGPFGISVERVATELGLANSSLYATYENKDTMIRETVIKEFLRFGTVISSKLPEAKSLSEGIYIVIATAASYSAQSLPLSSCIVSWICLNGNLNCSCEDFEKVDFKPTNYDTLDIYFTEFQSYCEEKGIDIDLISRWVVFLPFSLFFFEKVRPELHVSDYSNKSLYRLVESGLEGYRRK